MSRLEAVLSKLLAWYAENRRDLPWRETSDPYAILISEVMLQQTQVERVLPKYRAWLRCWPTLTDLAAASTADILIAWQGLGYNRRALNLKRLAETAVAEYGGSLPTEVTALEALPGIGAYTARAVAIFSRAAPELALDTNVRRMLWRLFFGRDDVVPPSDQQIAEKVLPAVQMLRSDILHQTMMDFGSAVCLQRQPRCTSCPLVADAEPARVLSRHRQTGQSEGPRRFARATVLCAVGLLMCCVSIGRQRRR